MPNGMDARDHHQWQERHLHYHLLGQSMCLKQARQLCSGHAQYSAHPERYTATSTTIMDDGAGPNTEYQDILRSRSIS